MPPKINLRKFSRSNIVEPTLDPIPEEKEEVMGIVRQVMNDAKNIIEKRYNIVLTVPLKSDIKVGVNALEGIKI